MRGLCVVLMALAFALSQCDGAETFAEEILLRRVRDPSQRGVEHGWEDLVTHMQFTQRWEQGSSSKGVHDFAWDHFNLFPMQFAQTMRRFKVEELELSFAKGHWAPHWGTSPAPAATGVELWALLHKVKTESTWSETLPEAELSERWQSLTGALAGFSCASLSTLGDTRVAEPRTTFGLNESKSSNLGLKYGQLPSEASCTENLTPLLKLLPCRSHSGLAQLISPTTLFRAAHHTMRLHFRRVCGGRRGWDACSNPALELVLSITLVQTRLSKEQAEVAVLVPHHRGGLNKCPVASSSRVFVETFSSKTQCEGVSAQTALEEIPFELLTDGKQQVRLSEVTVPAAPPVVIQDRYTTGAGRLEGGVVLVLEVAQPLQLRVLELIPSYLRMQPRSLQVKINEEVVPAHELWGPSSDSKITLSKFHGAPSQLELFLTVPAQGNVVISYTFRQAFLALADFPPDPNRGFDIPGTVLSYVIPGQKSQKCIMAGLAPSPMLGRGLRGPLPGRKLRLYAEPLSVSMPLPDFSMPYNVITLSSTVFAYLFGSIMSSLLQPVHVRPEEDDPARDLRRKRKAQLKNLTFVVLIGLAWLFENDRDAFNELISYVSF